MSTKFTGVNVLNRRTEQNIAHGQAFAPTSQLWHEYGRVMAASSDATPVATALPPLKIGLDGDATVMQGPDMSLAPGAGSTSFLR